ncbi:MAG: DNRLRE domain-containing protein, partial [Actinobacteria bacterium]|nr:DNRLRE domain-containing protein [Actinomycetota bacterium]
MRTACCLYYSSGRRSVRGSGALAMYLALIAIVGLYFDSPAGALTDIGFRGFSYNDEHRVQIPTADKPQSKLWFQDRTWWGLLYRPSAAATRIHRLDQASQTWVDAGTTVDTRPKARADALWDGTKLYVVSGTTVESEWGTPPTSTDVASGSASVSRFSYEPATKTYSRDPGFPVNVYDGSSESITLAKDSTGQLWVTYTRDSKVWVNRSLNSDNVWGDPFLLPAKGTDVHYDDISAVVAFADSEGPKVGVMWSNQNNGHKKFYFSEHSDSAADEAWRPSVAAFGGGVAGCSGGCGNDHLNLKQLTTDGSGRIFAAVKTAKQQADLPLVSLVVRDRQGAWRSHVFGQVKDQHTRPLVVIDDEHRQVFMFAVSPEVGGTIYYKQTSVDDIAFTPGLGEVFMQSSVDRDINDPTSTKQNVNSATGLVVLASANTNANYWHNYLSLASLPPAAPPAPTNLLVSPPKSKADSSLKLTWTDNSSGEDGFKIERKTGSGTFAEVARVGNDVTIHTDTALTPDTLYTYRVRAWNAAGDSGYSEETTGITAADGSARVFTPVADAYVDDGVPTSNFGAALTLNVDASPVQQSYVKFELAGLEGTTVTSAKLRLYVVNGSVSGGSVRTVSNTGWQEGAMTYDSRPAIDGDVLSTLGAVNVGQWQELDVTRAVSADGTLSLGLTTTSTDGAHYASR